MTDKTITTPWIDARTPDGRGGVIVVINSGISLTEDEVTEMKAAWEKVLAGSRPTVKDIVVLEKAFEA